MKTATEKKAYFKSLRDRWNKAKQQLADGDIKLIEAIIKTHGLNVSNNGFMFVKMQLEAQHLDGLPYLDAKTYKGWLGTGFRVRKGEKSTLDGITWVNCTKKVDPDKTFMMPKGYHLFHRTQVDAV
jgi:hypothetical protein